MAAKSHLENLNIRELIAFIFLVEEDKSPDELKVAIADQEFLKRWQTAENSLRVLVKYYPNEEEERFYFTATLDAVHNIDPFSDETLALKKEYMPFIEILTR